MKREWTKEEKVVLASLVLMSEVEEFAGKLGIEAKTAVRMYYHITFKWPKKAPYRGKLSPEHKMFIRNNYQTMTSIELAEHCGVTDTAIRMFMKRNKLKRYPVMRPLEVVKMLEKGTTRAELEEKYQRDYLSIVKVIRPFTVVRAIDHYKLG